MKIKDFMAMHTCCGEQRIVIWVLDDTLSDDPYYEGFYQDMPEKYDEFELDCFLVGENSILQLDVTAKTVLDVIGNLEY